MPSMIQDIIDLDVQKYGRNIIMVGGESKTLPSFCYTIGNARVNLPELLCIGTLEVGRLMNLWSNKMITQVREYYDGELIDIGGKFPCMAVIATDPRAKSEYTIQAGQFYGHEDYRVTQILMPDMKGKFGPKAEKPYCTIPILRAGSPS